MKFELKHIKTLILAIFTMVTGFSGVAKDCLDLPKIVELAKDYNLDNVFPVNAELYKLGDLRILKPYRSDGINGIKTKIIEMLPDRLLFSGFLTLDVSLSPLDCKSLQLKINADHLIVDKDTVNLEGNVQYPIHSNLGYRINKINETYEISGRFKQVQIASGTASIFEACLTSCAPSLQCKAGFDFDVQQQQVTFKNTSNLAALQGGNFHWEFGDNNIGAGNNPTHKYESGIYSACLKVDNKNCIAPAIKVCKEIEIKTEVKEDCEVNFDFEIQQNLVKFTSTSTVDANNANEFEWSFGDGNESQASDVEIIHTYQPGIYEACLKVQGDQCAASSPTKICKEVIVTSCLTGNQTLLPNEDGIADYIFVKAGSAIYDRSGYLVLQVHTDMNWRGLDQANKILSMGVYTVVCGEGGKFNVTLIR